MNSLNGRSICSFIANVVFMAGWVYIVWFEYIFPTPDSRSGFALMIMMPMAFIGFGYLFASVTEFINEQRMKKSFSKVRIIILVLLWLPGVINALFFIWIFAKPFTE